MPQALADAWFTGPLLAANPAAVPRGEVSLEPYLLWSHANGSYDAHGRRHAQRGMADAWLTTVPIYYGITDRLTGQLTLNAAHQYGSGGHSDGLCLGDLGLRLSYVVFDGERRPNVPTVALTVTENVTTGRYDRLGANRQNGVGSGIASTALALNTQTYFWMPDGRILRLRANLSWSAPNGRTEVRGASVFGTGPGFLGHVRTGHNRQLDLSAEYSLSSQWVLVAELLYSHTGGNWLHGGYAGRGASAAEHAGSSQYVDFAPAVEYNFSRKLGVIGGVQFTTHGRNTTSEVIPQFAVNIVF